MARPAKRLFYPINREKYAGPIPATSRSGWEYDFMMFCDNNPDVIRWESEPKVFGDSRGGIPYRNPLTGKQTVYIPDFLVTYIARGGREVTRLIEIKPHSQGLKGDESLRNQAKWSAARAWAMRRGIEFVILTEADLYSGYDESKKGSTISEGMTPAQVKKLEAKKVAKNPAAKRISDAAKKIAVARKRAAQSTTRVSKAGKVGKARKARKV